MPALKKVEKKPNASLEHVNILAGIVLAFGGYYFALEFGLALENFINLNLVLRSLLVTIITIFFSFYFYKYAEITESFKKGIIAGVFFSAVLTLILTGIST